MQTLKEALTIERNRLFVGRESELLFMRNWLAQQDAPTQVLFISGMGGIGKSALMLQFLNMAQDENVLSIWLDGRICTETPAGFLEALHSFLNQSTATVPSICIADIVTVMSRQRTLVCVDNFEHLDKIQAWLREVFLPHFPATGLLVVLAARQDLSVDWQNDWAWRMRVRQMNLSPMSRLEAVKFYAARGLHKMTKIEQLISDTKGLPLAMALSVESADLTKSESETPAWPISMRVSAELLREVATSDLKGILDVLCILPQAAPELLGRLLGTPLTALTLDHLSRISFVRPTPGGFALHDVARAYLIEDFVQREPVSYQTIRLRIVEELVRQLDKADIHEKQWIAANLLSICRDTFQVGSTSIFAADPFSFTTDSYRSGDLPHLHALIAEQGHMAIALDSVDKIHELLDGLAEHFPDSFRVFRSTDGTPLAFIAGVLLYGATIDMLEPFIPGVLEACFPLEIKQMQRLQLEQADTFYQLLAAATARDPNHSFYEMNGILVTESLSRNSAAGMRCVLVTKWEETNGLLENLGFRKRLLTGLSEQHPSYGAYVHELDLRSSGFGEYVLSFLKAAANHQQAPAELAVTERDIQTALSFIRDTPALERSPLAAKLHCSGPELQRRLRTIILHDPPPAPLDSRKQSLLRLLCDAPSLSAEAAAARLHISRATYYRSRNEAIADLKELLNRQ